MSEHSKIEWTDATWNPVRGCQKVSRDARSNGRTFDERPPLTNTPMLDRETRRKAAENVLHELAFGFNDQPILATRALNRGR